MPTQLGSVIQKYGGVLPDEFNVANGTGDFAVIGATAGVKHAIYMIHLSNEGTAYKQFIMRNGTSGAGTAMGRISAEPDVEGPTIYFEIPLIVDALYFDAVSGTDSCYVSVISKKIVEGL
jgi:hypothetical protein